MPRPLLGRDLARLDEFLAEQRVEWRLGAWRQSGQIDSAPGETQVAVRLGEARKAIRVEHRRHPRRILLTHFVQPQHELDSRNTLLARDRGEQRVLGTAGTAGLRQDRRWVQCGFGSSVRQVPHMLRGCTKCGDAAVSHEVAQRSSFPKLELG
jgi:hypothetical protein